MTSLTPAAMRAMRGALNWSMRETAEASSVSLATVFKVEQGAEVSRRTTQRLLAAFRKSGVALRRGPGVQSVRILDQAEGRPCRTPVEIAGLPYVVAKRRAEGSWRVLFMVPKRLRPDGWPPVRPLPLTHPRKGSMTDKAEVAAIRADAAELMRQLERARTTAAQDQR